LAGVLLIFVNQLPDIPGRVEGNYPTAVFAFVCAAVTWIFSKDDLLKSAFVFVIAVSVFFNVAGLFLVPSLDIVMSPKKQAAIMKKYIAKGYKPAAYKVYSGLYTFYAGDDVSESKRLDEITKLVSSGEKVVLGIAEKHWKRWKGRPAGLRIVDEQWIAGRNYFLVINR